MTAERLRLAATLIEQSPPGQVSDVLRDLRVILGDDSGAVQEYLLEHLRNYNLEHLQTVCLPGSNEQSILCKAAVVPLSELGPAQERYIEPRSRKTFLFDHITHEMTDLEDYTIPENDEAFRAAVDSSLQAYLLDHYASSNSACAVFSSSPPDVPVSAVSTIASEDAEEEQILINEEEATSTSAVTEEKNQPTSSAEGEEKADTPLADAAEAVEPENVQGDSLLEKVAQTIGDAVAVVEEKILGEKVDESAADTADSTDATEAKEEPQSETQVTVPSPVGTTVIDPLEEKSIPESGAIFDASPVQPTESALLADPTYTIALVGNKYNTQNFWTGQWRSLYTVDPKVGSIVGRIQVDVHYFENGNVQLAAKEDVSLSVETNADNLPSAIITAIAKNEQAYQMKLNATYDDLGEKNFKSLRRPLPITRQRVEWEKIAAYKAGGGQLSK